MLPRVPRISSGASGLGSKLSICVTPPASQRKMTERALGRDDAVAAEAISFGNNVPATPSEPTRSKSRRDRSPDQALGGKEITACSFSSWVLYRAWRPTHEPGASWRYHSH